MLSSKDMVLRCTRLERILACRISSSSLVCRRHVSFSTDSPQPHLVHDEQLSHPLDDTVRPPPRPKVAEYLRYVAQNSEMTLKDLESLRPSSHSPVGSAQYEAEYEALMAKLNRSFTVIQLRKFLDIYGIPISKSLPKRKAASTIIEKKWDWPSLAQSQKLARSKKEVSTSAIPLDPHQAFLLLGKDGNEILSLSRTHDVHLRFSHKPLSLTIIGTTASVEQLEQHVEAIKEEIGRQDFIPPLPVDLPTSLQKLSRSSGCFLENLSDGKVRIWYRKSSQTSVSLAKKLIMQHAIKDVKVPLAAGVLEAAQKQSTSYANLQPLYALYPFFCGHTSALVESSGFRFRRVGRWFGQERVVAHINGNVSHHFVPSTGDHINAREQLLAQMGELDGNRPPSVTATPGHIVLRSQGATAASLSPPFEGNRNFDEVMDWVRGENANTEFIHSPPVSFWQAPDFGQPWRRRLVYETTGQTHILVFEYTSRKGIQVKGDRIDCGVSPGPTLRGGAVVRLDMFMPDETRDFRLTVTCNHDFPEVSWPNELSKLVMNDAPSRTPDAPLVLTHETREYVLREDSFVQSTMTSIGPESHLVNTASERRFDHQSSVSYLSYEVHCSDLSSDAAWQAFWDKCEKVVQDGSVPRDAQS